MPIFEYKCTKCGLSYEFETGSFEMTQHLHCPKCKSGHDEQEFVPGKACGVARFFIGGLY